MNAFTRFLVTLSLSALTASAAAGKSATPTGPVTLDAATRDSLTRALVQGRAETAEWLKSSPTSYFAAVQRVDFGNSNALTVGRAEDNSVRVDDPDMPEHAVLVVVEGDSFRVVASSPEGSFVAHKLEYREAVLPPSAIQIGRWTVRLSHQRFPALIVFDPKSPRYAEYHGQDWYPPDFSYRFEAPLTPNPKPDTTIIQSTRGNLRRAVRVGWFDLKIRGKACRLEAHRLLEPGVDEQSVSVFFRDATTGSATYGVGRYVDPEKLPDGRWRIDFNDAYNPACAFSPFYNCPIPSRANTLSVPIEAGEKDPHYEH
ncbi:MAG: DUF1684 domain-containing protein [Candidatus Eisenbacteria bacterium]|uniref:DUF1684 domain-containing protein n=1 Tax=Eiseniibacteriota bacterium TaxID=2212470 RepID=A0A933W247_UNCEI|nr:DUF1684 domain-containing protein [Candidatus Eisenbacteria bacterium]